MREHAEMLRQPRDRAAAAMPIAAGIDNDAGEPSRELCVSLEGVDLLDQLAANVLRDVFGFDDRTREPPRQPVDAIVVTPQEPLEGVAISRRGESGEFAIRAGAWLGTARAGRGRAVAAFDLAKDLTRIYSATRAREKPCASKAGAASGDRRNCRKSRASGFAFASRATG